MIQPKKGNNSKTSRTNKPTKSVSKRNGRSRNSSVHGEVRTSHKEDVDVDQITTSAEELEATETFVTTAHTTAPTTSQIVDEIAELCESILESPQQAFSVLASSTATSDDHDHSRTNSSSSNSKKKKSSSKKEVSKMDQLLHWARGGGGATTTTPTATGTTSVTLYDKDYISQLAIMSLLVIYKDILPSYRIRLPTTAEMAIKVSKDIQQLWDYERRLLNHYQQYLITLQNIWDVYNKTKNHPTTTLTSSSSSKNTLAVTCILSMAELLKSAFHFNFRSNLLTAVIRQMNYKHQATHDTTNDHPSGLNANNMNTNNNNNNNTTTIRTACCDAIRFVFQHDHQGDVTLEATRQISKYMKDREYKNIAIQMLQTLFYIPLRVHVDEAMAAKIATQVNKKKRKRNSEMAAIESEMKEGSTTVDKIVLAQCQSDTLQIVILTYFRILKSISPPSSSVSSTSTSIAAPPKQVHHHAVQDLLPTALEGLAKYAHLINIDTVIDLLGVLRDLLNANSSASTSMLLPVDATLNCILTAFQTLQGPGKEMKIDMKEYIIPLYNQIPRLSSYSCSYANSAISEGEGVMSVQNQSQHQQQQKSMTELLLQCLSLAFIQRREYSNVRIAAFMKQLLTLTLHCASSSDMSIPLLAFVRQLIQRYSSSLQQLYENEQDVITEGQYRMDVMDPEHANPYATSAWECTLLKFHYNTNVQTQAMNVATCKMLNLPMECPNKLHVTERNKLSNLYIPFARHQKRHPLSLGGAVNRPNGKSEDDATSTKNKRTNVRFITPRVKHCKIQIEPKMN